MILEDGLEFTDAKAKAFCKWYLRTTVADVEDEFQTEDERKSFLEQRERRLAVQLDDLLDLNFNSPITCSIENKPYVKIVNSVHTKPLSSEGALRASSRFNYKNLSELATRSIYFGQDKICCYAEKFHLAIQKQSYAKLVGRTDQEAEFEFKSPKWEIHEYRINIDKILVLTTESAYKALGIRDRVVKDEWYSVNDDFEIPTSGQILGRVLSQNGFKGILYTSVRSQTHSNLVIFEENTGPLEFELLHKIDLDHSNFE